MIKYHDFYGYLCFSFYRHDIDIAKFDILSAGIDTIPISAISHDIFDILTHLYLSVLYITNNGLFHLAATAGLDAHNTI